MVLTNYQSTYLLDRIFTSSSCRQKEMTELMKTEKKSLKRQKDAFRGIGYEIG